MKTTIVSAYDTLGMQVNGYLLHKRLLREGHDSRMVVYRKGSEDERVRELGSAMRRRVNRVTTRFEYRLGTHSVLPVLSGALSRLPEIADADIVNLQLIHNAPFFSLVNLPALSRNRPVVLSLHDMFMFTGHCVHSFACNRWTTGCGACPDLTIPFAIALDTTAFHWRLKKWVFGRSDIDLVVGSAWLRDRVRQSPILSHLPLHHIPFGVDEAIYKPGIKFAARSRLGIPQDADVIAFRSSPFGDNPFKGTPFVEAALQQYVPAKDTWLITFDGVGGLDPLRNKYRILELGWVYDERSIAEALNAADLFLMPSIAESFGLMAIEAMACGTPSIVFEGTALTETINAPECGIAVRYKDSEALAGAIQTVLADNELRTRLRESGLQYFSAKHTFSRYASAYMELFRRLSADRKIGVAARSGVVG